METMKSFFFTYGTDECFPFSGGWTQVNAPNRHAACELFKLSHPCLHGNTLNCAWIYDEETFQQTEIYLTDNLGHRCHEVISMMIYPGEEHWGEEVSPKAPAADPEGDTLLVTVTFNRRDIEYSLLSNGYEPSDDNVRKVLSKLNMQPFHDRVLQEGMEDISAAVDAAAEEGSLTKASDD